MRSSSKRPSDYLGELAPLPESRFKVGGCRGHHSWAPTTLTAFRSPLTNACRCGPRPVQDAELLQQEAARVAAGEAMQAMDTARYNLDPPPPSKRGDHAAWRAALDNAYAQLEHQYNRWVQVRAHVWEWVCVCACGGGGEGGHNGERTIVTARGAAAVAAERDAQARFCPP